VVAPIQAQLLQGTSPDSIALALAVGAACGLFPIFGATTALSLLVGARLRLNHVLMQMVNHLLGPLQLACILLFVRAGEWVWRAPHEPLSVAAIRQALHDDTAGALRRFGMSGVHAVSAWLLAAPFLVAALFLPLRYVTRTMARRLAARRAAQL
jgi:uncharacterized protein (DUF2062 family)